MNRHTRRILCLADILARHAADCAISLTTTTITAVLPVLLPLDQGAPPVLPGRTPLSWYR